VLGQCPQELSVLRSKHGEPAATETVHVAAIVAIDIKVRKADITIQKLFQRYRGVCIQYVPAEYFLAVLLIVQDVKDVPATLMDLISATSAP